MQSKALPQVLKLLAPRGALAQDDASGLFLMIGSLQVYKSDSICSDYALLHFPAGLTLLMLVGAFMHLHSLQLQLAVKSGSCQLGTLKLKRVCNCAKPLKTSESASEPSAPSLPPTSYRKKDPQFLRSDISFRVFLLEVFLGEPRLVAYGGIKRTAAVEC